MTFKVRLTAAETRALAVAASVNPEGLVLEVHPPHQERRFEPGDRVRVEFDDGYGPATVVGLFTAANRAPYVEVSYGPGGKHRTNLPTTSVATDNVVHHPARIEVHLP